ncbi:hypothetical protein [Desulfobacter sp. UBA2225]|uniref:hypothetical protein n=1 Tax=Desulfobacter sp. UBA2225 TaxID=1961413 RepID=UPI0025805A87|nr:hypothetical protein [Desulfobacter sp. UBA2225]
MDSSFTQVPLTIAVYPHFMDHCFAGKVVFPAVEALKVLAGLIGERDFFHFRLCPGAYGGCTVQ